MKIIRTAKYVNALEGDPYSVDFEREEAMAKRKSTEELFGALSDAIEASEGANGGKYLDQASVYRKELGRRGFSIPQQDEKLKTIPSLHRSPNAPGSNQTSESSKCQYCGRLKHWQEFSTDNDMCNDCVESEQSEQRAGRAFKARGEHLDYPELGDNSF